MDPLSDVLSLLRPRSYMFHGLDAGDPWSLRFPPHDGIRCYAILGGACWLVVEGVDTPTRLGAGDCALVTRPRSVRLTSDIDLAPTDAVALMTEAPEGSVVTFNGGGATSGLGGYFNFAGRHAAVLLALLPPVVHIRKEADRIALRASMEMLMQELREPQPGGALVARHLGSMMLVLALRLLLADASSAGEGWLCALADRQLGAALNALHADPARRWTLESLAERASMSRSAFALRFKRVVGEPPMTYLVRWRMLLAGDRLMHTSDTLSTIAYGLGYDSDSAFGAAFRRVMGCSPRQYARSPERDPDDSAPVGGRAPPGALSSAD